MPDLVGGGAAKVEGHSGATGEGVSEDVATVLVEGGGARVDVCGEIADAEEAAAQVGEEVDVQVGVVTLAEGGLHLAVVVAGGPLVVDGEIGGDEIEGDAVGTVRVVHVGELRS